MRDEYIRLAVIAVPQAAAHGVAERILHAIRPSIPLSPSVQIATGASFTAHNTAKPSAFLIFLFLISGTNN